MNTRTVYETYNASTVRFEIEKDCFSLITANCNSMHIRVQHTWQRSEKNSLYIYYKYMKYEVFKWRDDPDFYFFYF